MKKYHCATCQKEISTYHGRYRAKKRGYGYCGPSCEGAARTKRAHENIAMRVLRLVDMRDDDECWPFKGRLNHGYGVIGYGQRDHLAHRLVFQIIKQSNIDGMIVCHSCDNPRCCNPGHLWLGSQQDNMADMKRKGRCRNGGLKGVDHGGAKLTDADVIAIRQSSETPTVLGRQYGVTYQQIQSIRSRKTWKHIDGN